MDTLTKEQRSERMSRVRSKNSKPEMLVRRIVHSMGYRYRLHDRRLPGTPDLVFAASKKLIFVHGCFWHGHPCKLGDRPPKSRIEFWSGKIAENKARDMRDEELLAAAGWRLLVLWECELKDQDRLRDILGGYLSA